MKILIFSLLWLFTIPPSVNGCLEIDIILIGDLSGSVDGNEYFVADAFDAFIDRFELSENTIRIGSAIFDDRIFILSELTHNRDKLLAGVNFMRNNKLGGSTNMFGAAQWVNYEFSNNGRSDTRKMLIIVSDGAVNHPLGTKQSIEILRKNNIEICGIYINTNSGNEDFMMNVSEPYCYVSTSYETLVMELEKLDICF